jgi:hypothetical protein
MKLAFNETTNEARTAGLMNVDVFLSYSVD